MGSNEVILEVEKVFITCNKDILIKNSDYFKAMFTGSFMESKESVVKLEGVDVKAVRIILALLWDDSILIGNEDILMVLQAACMFQFIKIKNVCISMLTEMLSPPNCIQIWIVTEQYDIKPLCLKAKCMALDEFMFVKEADCILEMNLDKICQYLAHVNLKTDEEITVFPVAMRWWYEHHDKFEGKTTEILKKLMLCLDYTNLTESDIDEIMTYPDVCENSMLIAMLECYLQLRNGCDVQNFAEETRQAAQLLNNSKSRMSLKFPCILAMCIGADNKAKKPRMSSENDNDVVYYDKFRRKRFYQVLESNDNDTSLATLYYDSHTKMFRKLVNIDNSKCQSLDGFKLVAYKEFLFMYGGEFLIGKGNWNYNFWVFDTIRERWERKSVLPFPRRHFESCMIGSFLYIIGGTGVFRVIQENMFWYDYKEDTWSSQIMLPSPGRQLKCCNFQNKLFLLNISNKCGYLFDHTNSLWIKMDIRDNENIIASCSEFSIFSYKSSLFIKGNSLIELSVLDKTLVIVNKTELVSVVVCDKQESVLCNNVVYTLYKYKLDESDTFSLEQYNLDTGEINYIFQHAPKDCVISIDDQTYSVSSSMKLFSFHHYNLVEKNSLVNGL